VKLKRKLYLHVLRSIRTKSLQKIAHTKIESLRNAFTTFSHVKIMYSVLYDLFSGKSETNPSRVEFGL